MWLLPALLLRHPLCEQGDQTIGRADARSVQSTLRERFNQAEVGQWRELVADYAEELKQGPEALREAKRATTGKTTPMAEKKHTVARAMEKACGGSLKAAAALLTGMPPHPPSHSTQEKVDALFPQASAEEVEDTNLEALKTLRDAPALKVRPRAVQRRLDGVESSI